MAEDSMQQLSTSSSNGNMLERVRGRTVAIS
jgi:hypothetical protein